MFSSQMSPGSPFFVLTGDVVRTDVVGNGLPTLAFSRGIDIGEGRLWYGEDFAWCEAIDCCSREPNSGKIQRLEPSSCRSSVSATASNDFPA